MHKLSCIFIRHGKTKGNIEKRYTGCRTDEDLCDIGVDEIKNSFLKDLDIKLAKRVFASPMKRCTMTAKLLFPESELVTVEDFKEIDFGEFENKNYEELKGNEAYQKWIDSNGTLAFLGGESQEEFILRTVKAFKNIIFSVDEDEDGIIPFVFHGGNIMAIMSVLLKEDYFSFQIFCGEAYIVDFLIDEEKIDVLSYSRVFRGCDT